MKSSVCFLLLLAASLVLWAQSGHGQNLLDTPLGIVYDSMYNRYLVATYFNGDIIQINEDGSQSYFFTGLSYPVGLVLESGLLYAVTNEPDMLVGINLETAQIVQTIPIPTSGQLDGFTSDGEGICYIADPIGVIHRVDTNDETHSILVSLDPGVNETKYDEINNRLIVINFAANSPLVGIDLADTSVYTITATNIGGFTGIARDGHHNYYFSSSITNCVHRWDSTFANPPEVFSSGHNYPSGLCWNEQDNIIGLSDTENDTVVFIPLEPSYVESEVLPFKINSLRNYPNPFNNSTRIEFCLSEPADVTLTVYDLLGRRIRTLLRDKIQSGEHSVLFSDESISSGMYFYNLRVGDIIKSESMLLLK